MLSQEWRTLARRYIVHDIPDEIAACFDCDLMACRNARYETCAVRLTRAAAADACDEHGQHMMLSEH